MKIKGLMNKRAQLPEFDTDGYKQIAVKSEKYTDVYSGKDYSIPLICAGKCGIYVFITTNYQDEKHLKGLYSDISRTLSLGSGVYTFIRTEKTDYFVHKGTPIVIEYMLDKFENLYLNNLRPQNELIQLDFPDELSLLNKPVLPDEFKAVKDGYVIDQVSSTYLKTFKEKIEQIKNPDTSGKKVIYRDGIKYVKHPITKLGVIVSENYFPVADEDPWHFLLLTVFGGIAGAHKLKVGEYLRGVIYALTCGFFGIGYLTDIFSILTGTYYVTQTTYSDDDSKYSQNKLRIYVDTLDKKQKIYGFGMLLLGAGLVYVCYRYIYHPMIQSILQWSLERVQETAINR